MVAANSTFTEAVREPGLRVRQAMVPGVWTLGDVLPEVLARYGLEATVGCGESSRHESSSEERVPERRERSEQIMPLLAAGH